MTIQYDNLDTSISAVGSASNIPIVFRTKGTSALDLSAGSSGINISNGNTVTAITGTSAGTGYSSFPSVAISAPQIAGGTQATASVARMFNNGVTVQSGGTGYTNGDVLTVVGGTPVGSAATLTVTSVSGGVITGVSATNQASYTALPTNPVSVTGGTGLSATFNLTYGLVTGSTGLSITNAGSGYVEQPTVTFSGGGGSGAAAYATVGSATTIKSLGSGTASGISLASIVFSTPNSVANALTIRDVGGADTGVLVSPNTGYSQVIALGATNANFMLASNGTGSLFFNTQGTSQTNQMRVAHTASAVNYMQVTGAATTSPPIISMQGSDANVSMRIYSKGSGVISFWTAGGSSRQFQIGHVGGTVANYAQVIGSISGASPAFSVDGSDSNIDLILTPKGTGLVRFGTRTATSDVAITGYLEIKDSGGTTRKLAIID